MLNANPRNFLLSTLPEVLHHADGCIRHVYFPTDAIVSMMHVSEARSSTAAATSVSSIDPCSNKRPASAINEPARPGRLRGSGCHRNPARLQQTFEVLSPLCPFADRHASGSWQTAFVTRTRGSSFW